MLRRESLDHMISGISQVQIHVLTHKILRSNNQANYLTGNL